MILRHRHTHDQEEEGEYFNPARRHLKKVQKKQVNPAPAAPSHANTELQCRFKDISS